jgi:AraC-like DNA-binding protein
MASALFAGGIFILFFALAQLAAPKKQPMHYLMLGACVGIDYVILYAGAVDAGLIARAPFLLDTDLAAAAYYAPFLFLAAGTILHEGRKPVRRYAPFFVAPAPVALAIIALNALEAGSLGALAVRGYFASPLRTLLRVGVVAIVAAALAAALLAAYRLRKGGLVANKGSFRHQVVFLSVYEAICLVVLAGAALEDAALTEAAFAVLCPVVLVFALTRTDVRFFPPQAPAPARAKPSRPEWDSGDGELGARLDAIMRESAPYRRANLSLKTLARMAGVEPKRLSYHFNARHGTNFRGYVNSWRLEAIREELLKRPDRSILEIAFENGFNSKSSFNTLFSKAYGMTPRECRRRRDDIHVIAPPAAKPR